MNKKKAFSDFAKQPQKICKNNDMPIFFVRKTPYSLWVRERHREIVEDEDKKEAWQF